MSRSFTGAVKDEEESSGLNLGEHGKSVSADAYEAVEKSEKTLLMCNFFLTGFEQLRSLY